MEKIKIQAKVLASQNKVWNCYTDPTHIVNWNFASDDWCCPNAENDLRIGGNYSARMEAKDGSFGFDFKAIYRDIDMGKSFKYEIEDGRKVEVDFNQIGEETEVSIAFDAETQNSLDMQRDGWQAILNNFKSYVEGLN